MTSSRWMLRATATAMLWMVGVAAPPATAADVPAKKAASKTATKGKNVMTRDELRACMLEQDRLEKASARIKKLQAELDQQAAEVRRMDEGIARKRAAIDPNDASALQALNADETERDALAEAYNARLPGLREQGSQFDEGHNAWSARCGNRNYDEMDEAVIRREMRRAAGASK